MGSTPTSPRSSSWAGSRGRRGFATCSTRRSTSSRRRSSSSAPARPTRPELHDETAAKIESLREAGRSVLWIEETLPRPELIQIVTNASVFVCPSVYEPLGIVNLEAMACETAVVATRTGGIPEVVEDGVTGLLVPLELADDGSGEPADPARFAHDIAERVNALLADPPAPNASAGPGARGVERFGWARSPSVSSPSTDGCSHEAGTVRLTSFRYLTPPWLAGTPGPEFRCCLPGSRRFLGPQRRYLSPLFHGGTCPEGTDERAAEETAGADRDPGRVAEPRRRPVPGEADGRRRARGARPPSSRRGTTSCARSCGTASRGAAQVGRDADGAARQRSLARLVSGRDPRPLGVHDRRLDRPVRLVALRARAEARRRPGRPLGRARRGGGAPRA